MATADCYTARNPMLTTHKMQAINTGIKRTSRPKYAEAFVGRKNLISSSSVMLGLEQRSAQSDNFCIRTNQHRYVSDQMKND